MSTYVLSYDIGTTGVKTCLFAVDETIREIDAASCGYPLYILPDGGAEQDQEDWWQAMCRTTREVFARATIKPEQVAGISFCSQMQGFILVDADGVPVHRPMSYMDQRAEAEIREGIAYGLQIAGANIRKLLPSLKITGAVSSSVKDPLWKYKWLEAHEPENFARGYKWLDVKEYLISRCTGNYIMTQDSAYSTFLYDTRKGHEGWSSELCRLFNVKMELLPEIIKATDRAGELTPQAAAELGLAAGTPVFGGGGDATLIGIGSGCVKPGDTHIYSGTSGWVSTIVEKQLVDTKYMIAAIVGAQPGKFNYFAEMETAGKCLEWVKDHLALDEIGIYLEKHDVCEQRPAAAVAAAGGVAAGADPADQERIYTSVYDYLTATVAKVPPGAGGVIFCPWLHGNRCPFEDSDAAGLFFNIKLETGKTEMIRAVLEGVCYHLRWMLECQDRKIKTSDPIRFSGGGALSDVTSQMLSDITGREIEVVDRPQNVGSVGAAAVTCVGLGLLKDLEEVAPFIPAVKRFTPDPEVKAAYDKNFAVFKELHACNKKLFKIMNN
ncbi:MAG: FGGY-family carbohydrate kinase [Firmicutes bacterium]|nr:FGGY-family carbohydrate kinase [Bacillota bacterium]